MMKKLTFTALALMMCGAAWVRPYHRQAAMMPRSAGYL
jgi:hypothetical protein